MFKFLKSKVLWMFVVFTGIGFLWVSLIVIPADLRRACQYEVDEASKSDISVMQADYLYMECVRRHGLSR